MTPASPTITRPPPVAICTPPQFPVDYIIRVSQQIKIGDAGIENMTIL
jgi:hypothetical protein